MDAKTCQRKLKMFQQVENVSTCEESARIPGFYESAS